MSQLWLLSQNTIDHRLKKQMLFLTGGWKSVIKVPEDVVPCESLCLVCSYLLNVSPHGREREVSASLHIRALISFVRAPPS